jgi:hypothetical protein
MFRYSESDTSEWKGKAVEWVERLQEAINWHEERRECDWSETEEALGVSLPSDFKELFECFGPGEFSSSLWLMGDQGIGSILHWWRKDIAFFEDGPPTLPGLYAPHEYYGVDDWNGVIHWGHSDAPGMFFWLADAEKDPDEWPVVARAELVRGEEWYEYEMTASEFVFRMLTEPESYPLSMRHPHVPPTFESSAPRAR